MSSREVEGQKVWESLADLYGPYEAMNPVWQPIPDYVGLYEVSTDGRVRSVRREGTNGRELKPLANRGGYLKVVLSKCDKTKNLLIHQLVARTFLPNPNSLPEVDHQDGVRTNNSLSNLEWVTGVENRRRAYIRKVERLTFSRPNFPTPSDELETQAA